MWQMDLTATPTVPWCGTLNAEFFRFTTLSKTVGECYETPQVELGQFCWSVKVYPGGVSQADNGYVSCSLVNRNKENIVVDFTVKAVNAQGVDSSFPVDVCRATIEVDGEFKIDRFCLYRALPNIASKDVLRLRIDIKRVETSYQMISKTLSPFADSGCTSTCDVYPSDISIRVAETGVEIPAHKYVLAVHSPVFRAMFKSDMQEVHNSIIEITDFSEPVVREFVRFLYDRCIKSTLEEHVQQLLLMADKYQVMLLFRLCEDYLADHLDAANVVPLLLLAHERSATLLKDRALRFLRSQAGDVSEKGTIHDLPAVLVRDILAEMAKCT